ncbi:hypothetical protein LSH36_550g01013 [Paralvinella palmiformis]|uniref:EF-hand domain-containing protein n=1 Tax=Paralvinella palmiformis TaxID=53620 RepID=A0AAD9J6X8_9ANNE|nr:hypothetical protein LSH36_550g01013 [Paralvinella palmiformis]
MTDRKSDAFIELYQFLLSCFIRADTDLDGKVHMKDFDTMIEEAAVLPRRYGFAPKSSDIYPNDAVRKEARAKMFKEMNLAKDGYITLEEWISFSVEHIMSKVKTLSKDVLTSEDVTKEEFLEFTKKAVDKSTPEYRDLYSFLLKCFVDADKDRDGAINVNEFDQMIEVAAAAPRRHGLAPTSSQMFKSDAERLAKRAEYFKSMDVNKDGTISFDEWLQYSVEHITKKLVVVA